MIVETSGWCHLNEKNRHTENIGTIQIPFIPLPTPQEWSLKCATEDIRSIYVNGYR